MPPTTRSLASALAAAATAAAHGYVSNVVINGVSYPGYDVTSFPYQDDSPVVIGWGTSATDLGFVSPDAYSDPDIICHRDGANAKGHAQVAAGDSIYIQWNTWPDSHHGPVIDYLASCGDSGCESVDKTALKFFKIDQAGLVDGSGAPGIYGSDELIENSVGWMVKIPEDIAPGSYVLRHEIIALHSAGEEDGAQNYPQCFNLQVTGSGSKQPQGTLGTELYTPTDDGVLFNIYQSLDNYPVPGPALIAGASAVEQSSSAIQSTGTATQGSGSVPTATSSPATPTAEPTNSDSGPTADPTTAPASTSAPSSNTPTAPSSSTETPSQPEETATPPNSCRLKKRSKKSNKVRRHVRDVKARNVAPLRA